jgi:hypothetical protein
MLFVAVAIDDLVGTVILYCIFLLYVDINVEQHVVIQTNEI